MSEEMVEHDASDLEQVFVSLANEWRNATEIFSSAPKKAEHPAYRQIIDLGWRAVPLILKELQSKPEHWFYALTAITGENPIPPQDRGNLRKMSEAWLAWGRSRGIA